MNRQYLFTITVLAGLMLLLVSCFRYNGVGLTVINSNSGDSISCSGGLQATFQAGSLTIRSPKVEEGKLFDKAVGSLPGGVGTGTLVTVEAWCYDADVNKPTGYIRIEERWRYDSVNSVYIYSPARGNRSGCVRGMQEKSPVPCVDSRMLSD